MALNWSTFVAVAPALLMRALFLGAMVAAANMKQNGYG
jgi:hypothetical protein